MGGKGIGENSSYHDDIEKSDEERMILAIARALRGEFGMSIDAHPGGLASEAGIANRAFRVVVRSLLARFGVVGDLTEDVTRALRLAAMERLTEIGVDGRRAEELVGSEQGLADRWLAYLALSTERVVMDMISSPVDPRTNATQD